MRKYFIAMFFMVLLLASINISAYSASYYVSSSEGNDANDGLTQETAFKTIARLNEMTFNAGDNIFLKCGDVWEESFFPKGDGSSKNWITLSSYGEGPKPKISPKGNPTYGIYLDNYAGWRIVGLEVCNTQTGIRLLLSEADQKDGLWIEDCYIHHIENAPQYPNNVEPGLFMSYGISTYKVLNKGIPSMTNVTIKNCLIEDTDAPMTLCSINNLVIENVIARNSYKEGVLLSQINQDPSHIGIMKNCKILNTGYPKGMYWGTAGMQFNSTKYFVMEDCEIAYTKAPGCPDGVGVDFEGNNVDVTVKKCYIHDNEGTAFMTYRNPTWGVDNIRTNIIGCRVENNGLKGVKAEAGFLRHKFNKDNGGIISDNEITIFEGQPLNLVDSLVPELTDRYPPGYTVYNNIVKVAELGEYKNYKVSQPEIEGEYVKVWNFEKDEDLEGWKAGNAVDSGVVKDGVMTFNIIARDPYILSSSDLGIDIDKNKLIKIRFKHDTLRKSAKFYFLTDDDKKWNESKAKSFSILGGNDDYVEYIVDMSDVDTWTGTLYRFRFDPIDNVDGVTGTFSVDYILIGQFIDLPVETVEEDAAEDKGE